MLHAPLSKRAHWHTLFSTALLSKLVVFTTCKRKVENTRPHLVVKTKKRGRFKKRYVNRITTASSGHQNLALVISLPHANIQSFVGETLALKSPCKGRGLDFQGGAFRPAKPGSFSANQGRSWNLGGAFEPSIATKTSNVGTVLGRMRHFLCPGRVSEKRPLPRRGLSFLPLSTMETVGCT